MRRLNDTDFSSLPVPIYIRKLLTYRDVAEKVLDELHRKQNIRNVFDSIVDGINQDEVKYVAKRRAST